VSRLIADSINVRLGPQFSLSDVFLDAHTADVLGLVGRNGCGKTTLLRVLFGLVAASGVVKVDGHYVAADDRWRHMAYLPQHSFLPRDQEVRRSTRLFLGPSGERILEEDRRLRSLARRKVGELSAGERRLVEFHLIMGLNRSFVLLDEPFSQVEPIYVEAMSAMIRARSQQTAFILTDHNHWSVREVCTGLYSLDNGTLRKMGSEDSDLRRAGYLPHEPAGSETKGTTQSDKQS